MKKMTFYYLILFAIIASAQTQNNYDVTAANGNGLRFWNGNDNYKIHMGNTTEYKYGPVSDYSIKMNMDGGATRGWTWGVPGGVPVAALNIQGDFQIAQNFTLLGKLAVGLASTDYGLQTALGVQLRKTAIGITPPSPENSYIRDEWLTGNYGPPKWNQTLQQWVRPSGANNDIGGIVYQDEGTYFLRIPRGSKTEFSNTEFLDSAFLFSNMFNGYIGIGTNSPDSKLTVKGKIHAEEVKIDLTVPAPDYVFKEGYKLMSLEDIQQFIKEHGHLPNIPSAKDMEENGVELGVMNMKLLEKIEELTLYVIELKKMNNNQQLQIEKNASLKKEVALLQAQNMELAKRLKVLENR